MSGLVEHSIHANGYTQFVFCGETRISLELNHFYGKGFSITSRSSRAASNVVLSDASMVSIVCGHNKNRLCMECYCRINKIVKVRDDCKNLSYCSNECMSSAGEFIDVCGGLIDDIYSSRSSSSSSGSEMEDLQCLVIKLLFIYLQQSSLMEFRSLDTALRCETHSTIENAELRAQSIVLFNLLKSTSSPLLFNADGKETFAASLVYSLLCAFQYNSQPFPIPGLKGVHILSLFPTLSKLNHSCTPNAVLQFGIQEGQVIGYVKLLRDVEPGEELCFSYLSQTCMSFESRQELLSLAFQFKCMCEMCSKQATVQAAPQSSLQLENDRLIGGSSSAVSSGVVGINMNVQIGKAEELLNDSFRDDCEDDKWAAIVTAHDTALLVLQYCQGISSSPTTTSEDVNRLAVRACLIVCTCFKLSGGELQLSRLEFMVMCGQYAVKAKMNGNGVTGELVVRVRALLSEAETILSRHYCSSIRSKAVAGLRESDFLSDSGFLNEYYQSLLSKSSQILRAL